MTDSFNLASTGLTTVDSVLNNDSGWPLEVSEVNGNSANVGQQIELPSGALLKLLSNGTFEFTPASSSTSDSFSYKATDGIDSDTATVNIYLTAPSELYLAYQSAVSQADQAYANQIGAAATTRQANIDILRAAVQPAADQFYVDYLERVSVANAVYAATQLPIERSTRTNC